MNKLRMISSLVCASCLLAVATEAQSPVSLSINTLSPGPAIPSNFNGLSFGTTSLEPGKNGYFFDSTSTQVLALFQALGTKNLRIGGTSVDTNNAGYTPANPDIDALFRFANAAGLKVIYSVRLENGIPAQDAAAAQYVWQNYQPWLDSFSIGNEPDIYGGKDPKITGFPSYLADWQSFATAITNVVPAAKFSGPDGGDGSGGNSWGTNFAYNEVSSGIVTSINFHYYAGGSSASLTIPQLITNVLSPGWDTANYPAQYSGSGGPVSTIGFPWRFTEANSYYTGGGAGLAGGNNCFATALFAVDFAHWWAAHNAAGVNFHTAMWKYNGVFYPDANGNYQVYPVGYGIKAFDLGGHGNVEPVTMTNANGLNLTAYAVGDTTNLYVTVVNKEQGAGARNAAVTILPAGLSSGNAMVMYLTAPGGNAAATNGITLGGASITNSGPWLGQWTMLSPLSNGQCVVTVPATSAAVVKIGTAAPPTITNLYAATVLSNNPVGYWPMHEIEAPATGDIETNYGTLGLLGTGYYPDWVIGSGGNSIQHQVAGALAGDGDTAVYFGTYSSNVNPDFTNSLFIPHTSPLSTLNPPFSVECWYYTTNAGTAGNDIWSQDGLEGLNAGQTGGNNAGNGSGNIGGLRLFASGTDMTLYVLNGTQTAVGSISSLTAKTWYHIVVTCDAATNMSLYVNGALKFTAAAVGKYIPDYWTPFEAGNGRGNTRAMDCKVDELAIYTNAISDISQHYSDGINPAPATSYYYDVTNDNPVIYLRMDGPAYTTPGIGTWPPLINYGSVAVNGVYAPGTMPGIVSGPAFNGVSSTGLSGTNVAQLSGVSSFADAGYAAAYNPVGAVPFSVIAMFRGNPCDGRVQAIVGHSDNSWRILMNTNGTLQCQLGMDSGSLVNSSGVYNDGKWHQVIEVYTPASNPALTGTNALYVDGVLDSMTNRVNAGGILPGTNLDVLIGSDPQYTNSPAGVGRQFAGQVCEVALFSSALTTNQVTSLFNAGKTAVVTPGVMSVTNLLNGQAQLIWGFGGTLQSATNVTGPYSTITGAISPYSVLVTNAQQFYRIREN